MFRNHHKLSFIDFSFMGLYGDLDSAFARVPHKSWDFSPLALKLQRLYLDENNIGAVQVLPPPVLEEISLRGNRNLNKLPMKWFTDTHCQVDVRNTSLVSLERKRTLS